MFVKVRLAGGLAVIWFTRRELEWDAACRKSSWPLPQSAGSSKGQDCKNWFDLQPTHIAEERLASPQSLSFPCQSYILFGYFLLSTVKFFCFFFPSPSFRRAQVCVHSTVEMCWLVYKGSNIKLDQEILVPLYTESLPSHGSKCHKPNPLTHPQQEKVMKSYCHIVVVTCLPLSRTFLSSSLQLAQNLNDLISWTDGRKNPIQELCACVCICVCVCACVCLQAVQQTNLTQMTVNRHLQDCQHCGPSS